MKGFKFRLEDALAPFRGLERTEDAIIVLGDEEAMRVLVAWEKTDQQWEKPPQKQPPAQLGKMERLWKWIVWGWQIDERRVSQLTGLPVTVVHSKLEILMGNRLIYPDGSISKGARSAMMTFMAQKLGIKQQQPPPPGKPDAKAKKKRGDDETEDDDMN